MIPRSGGLRKIRLVVPGKGKRGGARAIYAVFLNDTLIVFAEGYMKNQQADLTKDELNAAMKAVGEVRAAVEAERNAKPGQPTDEEQP